VSVINLNLFRKKPKKEEPSFVPPPSPETGRVTPTHEVQALSSRGVPEPDIINTLRREGYSTSEIDQAMKEALKSRVSGEPQGPPPAAQPPVGGEAYSPAPEPAPIAEQAPSQLAYPGRDELPEREPYMPPPAEPAMPGNMPRGQDFYPSPPIEEIPDIAERPRKRSKGIDRRDIEELVPAA